MSNQCFSLYLSHSWRPNDVDLNIYIWRKLSKICNLLVDENFGSNPPYYINRIEEYIRRSDLFFAILTLRTDERDLPKCSKASLFEVRLAERARKPRFVLYERGCGFRPPEDKSDYIRYEVFDRKDLLDFRRSSADKAIEDWLGAMEASLKPRTFMFHEASLALLPDTSGEVPHILENALLEGGYSRTRLVDEVTTDFEIMNKLASTGLLVADITVTTTADVLAMAHAVFLPTIRIARKAADGSQPPLPWYLTGHPGMGYDTDVVYYSEPSDLYEPVKQRAGAMRDTRKSISSEETGCRFFERRRWRPHRIFISHSLKQYERQVVDELFTLFEEKAVDAWEYVESGEAGEDWKSQLKSELAKATHAVILVGEGFNDSDICCDEVDFLKSVSPKVVLLPFLIPPCDNRAVAIREMHHELLPPDSMVASKKILQKTLDYIKI